RLARQLEPLTREKKWVLRESRQVEPCMKQLAGPGPSVLVLRLSASGDVELALLARVAETMPQVATVAVPEVEEPPGQVDIAWDLDANFVLAAAIPMARLPAIVEGLMGQP